MSKNRYSKLKREFFLRDALSVAPDLIGKILALKNENGEIIRHKITETEAYRGDDDLACHASKGKTKRTQVMFKKGGFVYVYLIYGMYWMLNIVTGQDEIPQAVLIRGVHGINGPGRLGKALHLDKSYYGEDLIYSERIWVEDAPNEAYITTPRI